MSVGADDLVLHLAKRSVTVRAQSELLRTVGISEEDFESVLGDLKTAVHAANKKTQAAALATAKKAEDARAAAEAASKAQAEEAARLVEEEAKRARYAEELENA